MHRRVPRLYRDNRQFQRGHAVEIDINNPRIRW